jgi:hypothetical protein
MDIPKSTQLFSFQVERRDFSYTEKKSKISFTLLSCVNFMHVYIGVLRFNVDFPLKNGISPNSSKMVNCML